MAKNEEDKALNKIGNKISEEENNDKSVENKNFNKEMEEMNKLNTKKV